MRDDFAVVVLSHGRAGSVLTLRELRRSGYTGPILLVLDDEDASVDTYRERFGACEGVQIVVFSKAGTPTDPGDNDPTRRGVVYARNAVRGIVQAAGYRYYLVLDDDYFAFQYRWDLERQYTVTRIRSTMDACLGAMVDFLAGCPPSVVTLCMGQGGDHIGGGATKDIRLKRKAMNAFLCDVERPFEFFGRLNEDVCAYALGSLRGLVFLTTPTVQVVQPMTQQRAGGLSELYLDVGTYVKSWYSVLYAPSCVQVGELTDYQHDSQKTRMHHKISWPHCAPKIVPETVRK